MSDFVDQFRECDDCQYAWRDIGVFLLMAGGVILFGRWYLVNVYDPVKEAESAMRKAINDVKGR